MLLKKWDSMPLKMRNESVYYYYKMLQKKKGQLMLKRLFDLLASIVGSIILIPIMIIIAILIKLDSKGPVIFKQIRVTQYGKEFKIFKFRTMVVDAEKLGAQVTSDNDPRVTKIGNKIRKYRLDELPQIFNILKGDLSFVGTRPEVPKYVNQYSEEMIATLLLPAGVTSEASIKFKDEHKLLEGSKNIDYDYINKILPQKMKYNLESLTKYSFLGDIKTIISTIFITIFNKKNSLAENGVEV